MGCAFTKSTENENEINSKKSGSTPNTLDIPEPPPPDPRLPLTARQKFQITKSWKGIARAMEPTGVNMFIKLFENNADLLNLFQKFQSLKTKDAQRESMELAQHASLVMSTLDEAINSLDNVDYFIDYLHSVGKMHRKIAGFKKEYFWKIEQPFLQAVKETLEDRFTENMEMIYKITVKFILETLVEGHTPPQASSDMPNGTASSNAANTSSNSADKSEEPT